MSSRWSTKKPTVSRLSVVFSMPVSIGKSNGLFHRPRPPTPYHSAPAGARAWRRPAPRAPPTLASTPPGRARGAPRHRVPPRTAGHGQDGWPGRLGGEWPDGTFTASYEFRHALYLYVLYERQGETQRVRLHRLLGERVHTLRTGHLRGSHLAEWRCVTVRLRVALQWAATAESPPGSASRSSCVVPSGQPPPY